MGRRIPSETISQVHPTFSITLLVTCIAAIVVVINALCGARIRKHSAAAKTVKQSENKAQHGATSKTRVMLPIESGKDLVQKQDEQCDMKKEQATIEPHAIDVPEKLLYPLPLPAGSIPGPRVSPVLMNKSSSTRHLRVSLSMKLPSLNKIRTSAREREKNGDECLWKKTIILGERCRIPGGDNEEEAVIYDEKGNRIVAYAPRTPRSLPVSRTISFIDMDAIPRRNL